MSEALLIYTTWPDEESARRFAGEAVEAGLAACANILAPMVSIYRWRGAVKQATETPMLLKTTRARLEALRARFVDRHPYETPAFVAVPVEAEGCLPPYLQWLRDETAA